MLPLQQCRKVLILQCKASRAIVQALGAQIQGENQGHQCTTDVEAPRTQNVSL